MEHLIKVPCGASLATGRFHLVCEAGAEFVTPSADRFIAHDDPALEQHLFDVAKAQLKPEYQRTAPLITAPGKR